MENILGRGGSQLPMQRSDIALAEIRKRGKNLGPEARSGKLETGGTGGPGPENNFWSQNMSLD
jgi:hypothetical protein